jgi:uncharacterized protein (DUF58 family)
VEGLRPLLLVLDLVFILACLVDFWRIPSPKRLSIGRSLPERAGLSVEFDRVVEIEGGLAAGLEVEVREVFSPHFQVVARTAPSGFPASPATDDPTGGPDRLRLREGKTRVVRRYLSTVRGVAELGDLRLRLTGALGLIQRQGRFFASQSISIEPALSGLARTLRLAASERWHDLGVRRLRRKGGLTEFESLRDYVHGDDPRLIDWKAFARRGRPIVRDYREERGQELIVLVDGGRRMGATTATGAARGWTKLDHALDAALELCAVALQAGDRVGIAVFDRTLRGYVPPAKGNRQLGRLRETVSHALPRPLESDLARILREISVLHRRRATLVILSDVADPLSVDRQCRALGSGSKRHRIVLATLDDPSLRAVVDGSEPADPAERAEAFALDEERRVARAMLRRTGVRVLDTLPAESAGPLLAAWLDARSLRSNYEKR